MLNGINIYLIYANTCIPYSPDIHTPYIDKPTSLRFYTLSPEYLDEGMFFCHSTLGSNLGLFLAPSNHSWVVNRSPCLHHSCTDCNRPSKNCHQENLFHPAHSLAIIIFITWELMVLFLVYCFTRGTLLMCSLAAVTAVASQSIETECTLMTSVGARLTFINISTGGCLVQRIVIALVAPLTRTVEPTDSIHTYRVSKAFMNIFPKQAFVNVFLTICSWITRSTTTHRWRDALPSIVAGNITNG